MSAYEAQSIKFLNDHGLTLKAARQTDFKCPPWCDDCRHGDHYRVTIKRVGDRKSISFDFWDSLAAQEKGEDLSAYSVLACISSDYYTPGTFKDFCDNYGYDQDSRKAEKTFKQCDAFARKLRAFLSEDEARALSEIQ